MKKSKAQISIFLLLGILLLILLIIFFLFYSNLGPLRYFLKESRHPVQYYVEECIRFQIVDAIEILSWQGGFIYTYTPNLTTERRVFAYSSYFNESTQTIQDTSPNVEFMENEISRYIENNIDSCIDNSTLFIEKVGLPEASTIIYPESVYVELNYPLQYAPDNVIYTFHEYSSNHLIPFGRMIELRDIIVFDLIRYKNLMLLDKLYDTDFEMIISPYSGKHKVITMINTSARLRNDPLEFNFAIKDQHVLPATLTFASPLPDITARVGLPLMVQVFCNHDCKFYDDTILFDINENTGIINYVTDRLDIGVYNITITITDETYTVSRSFQLTVEQ